MANNLDFFLYLFVFFLFEDNSQIERRQVYRLEETKNVMTSLPVASSLNFLAFRF